MDLHLYDYKINAEYSDISYMDLGNRIMHFISLARKVYRHLTVAEYTMLNRIVRADGSLDNHDKTNNIRADDMLILIDIYVKITPDFVTDFRIQLNDMYTGMCSQGRAVRLYQLYKAYKSHQPR